MRSGQDSLLLWGVLGMKLTDNVPEQSLLTRICNRLPIEKKLISAAQSEDRHDGEVVRRRQTPRIEVVGATFRRVFRDNIGREREQVTEPLRG